MAERHGKGAVQWESALFARRGPKGRGRAGAAGSEGAGECGGAGRERWGLRVLLPRGPGAPVGLRGAGPERGRERDAVAASRPALVRGRGRGRLRTGGAASLRGVISVGSDQRFVNICDWKCFSKIKA